MAGSRLPGIEPWKAIGSQNGPVGHPQIPFMHSMPPTNDKTPGAGPIGMPLSSRSTSSTNTSSILSPSPFHVTPREVPSELPFRQPIKISDISNERITESDARERLSSYIVVRLEKIDELDDVDEFGQPLRSAWEKVRQVVQTGISKQEAARQIHDLERKTKSVLEKKAALSPVIQRQLERAGEMLQEMEPDHRYHYVLVQFVSHLKAMKPGQVIYKNKGEHEKKKTHASKKGKSKRQYERTSITAYFKKVPRPSQNAKRMLEEKSRHGQMRHQMTPPSLPVQRSPQTPTTLLSPLSPVALPVPVHRGVQLPPAMPVQAERSATPKQAVDSIPANSTRQDRREDVESSRRNDVRNVQRHEREEADQEHSELIERSHIRERPIIQVFHAKEKHSRKHHGSPRSSDSSLTSESSWSSSDGDTMTAESSVGSGSHSSKISRGRSLKRSEPVDFIKDGRAEMSRRRSMERSQGEINTYPSRNLPPSVRRVPANLGVPRVDSERREPGLDRNGSEFPRSRDNHIQSGIRRVSPAEGRQEILNNEVGRMGGRLENLRLGDEKRPERSVRWEDANEFEKIDEDIRQRRALRARLQGTRNGDGFSPAEHKTRWSEHDAQEYMRRRQ